MKVAVITMVYNEKYNLPIWIEHYRNQLPNGELFVIDHGSDERVSDLYESISTIRVPRSAFDDRKRARLVSNIHNSLLDDFDWVIYTDSDELIVSSDFETLEDALANEAMDIETIHSVGINLFQHYDVEAALDDTLPIHEQRKYGVLEKSMFKPSISRSAIQWGPGFHSCNKAPSFGLGYYLIHLKYIDFQRLSYRAQIAEEITWSEEAVLRKWNRFQVITNEQITKKFQGIANFVNAGRISPFNFDDEKEAFLSGAVRDSKGNYRIDNEIKSRVLEVPLDILKKLP